MKTIYLLLVAILINLSAFSQGSETESTFKFVGHRGASYLAPENTLASIMLAWKLGADGAECDVMLSSDFKVLLCHDSNTKKLTGKSYVVSETTWAQLSKLTVKAKKTNLPEYDNEAMPLLEEILTTIPEDRMLVIEIKTGPEILPHLQKVIENHWKSGKISFIAFDFETISAAKALYPEVPCYYLSSSKDDLYKRLPMLLENQLDGVDLNHAIITPSLMEKCKSVGLDVWCWTVNDPETARKMKEMGVTAVTTDRPAWLKEHL